MSDTNNVLDIAGTLIALLAFGLACWQLSEQRKHNRQTFRPYLTDRNDQVINHQTYSFEFKLSNNGLGPAHIDNFELLHNGKSISENEFKEKVSNIKKRLNATSATTHIYNKGYAIPANHSDTILSITLENHNDDKLEQLGKAIDEFSLKIRYHSIYGTSYLYES